MTLLYLNLSEIAPCEFENLTCTHAEPPPDDVPKFAKAECGDTEMPEYAQARVPGRAQAERGDTEEMPKWAQGKCGREEMSE